MNKEGSHNNNLSTPLTSSPSALCVLLTGDTNTDLALDQIKAPLRPIMSHYVSLNLPPCSLIIPPPAALPVSGFTEQTGSLFLRQVGETER